MDATVDDSFKDANMHKMHKCINKVVRTRNVVTKQKRFQVCIFMSKYLLFVYYHFMFEYKYMYFSLNISECTCFQKISASSNISVCRPYVYVRG